MTDPLLGIVGQAFPLATKANRQAGMPALQLARFPNAVRPSDGWTGRVTNCDPKYKDERHGLIPSDEWSRRP